MAKSSTDCSPWTSIAGSKVPNANVTCLAPDAIAPPSAFRHRRRSPGPGRSSRLRCPVPRPDDRRECRQHLLGDPGAVLRSELELDPVASSEPAPTPSA